MERIYVDRIEKNIVICVDENLKIVEISRKKIKGNVVEGSVLIERSGKFEVDEGETIRKRIENIILQNEFFVDENDKNH